MSKQLNGCCKGTNNPQLGFLSSDVTVTGRFAISFNYSVPNSIPGVWLLFFGAAACFIHAASVCQQLILSLTNYVSSASVKTMCNVGAELWADRVLFHEKLHRLGGFVRISGCQSLHFYRFVCVILSS